MEVHLPPPLPPRMVDDIDDPEDQLPNPRKDAVDKMMKFVRTCKKLKRAERASEKISRKLASVERVSEMLMVSLPEGLQLCERKRQVDMNKPENLEVVCRAIFQPHRSKFNIGIKKTRLAATGCKFLKARQNLAANAVLRPGLNRIVTHSS